MSDLKPCPFCGGEVYVAKIEPRLYRPSCNHPCSVVCYNCDLLFGYDEDYGGEFDTEAEAIEAWNRRFVTDINVGSKVQERKNGKWIDEKINSYTSRTYCSECGKSTPFIYKSDDHYGNHAHGEDVRTNFCPNCGADMRGEYE